MSDGSDHNPFRIQTEPLRRIGAQDLMKVDYSIYGHLRKQGKLGKLFSSRKWSLKFIVVSQGCLYCFKDEHAENPVSAFSLCVYDSVNELDKSTMPHSFEIVHEEKGKPPHVFACETDEKRREWVTRVEEVLQQCRTFLGKLSADSGIDDGLPSRKPRRQLGPLPSVPGEGPPERPKKYKEAKSEYDLESTDDEDNNDEYDEVATTDAPRDRAPSPPRRPESQARPAATLPTRVLPDPSKPWRKTSLSERPALPIPADHRESKSRPNLPQPPVPPGQTPVRGYINNSVFEEREYMFDSTDRNEAFTILQGRDEGTFLVRLGRSGPGKVLTVNTPIGTKEFKITEKDGGKVSLDNKEFFPALSALLTYYNQNVLPKNEYVAKLERGYRTMS